MATTTQTLTPEEQYQKAVQNLKALGLRIPERDAWRDSSGKMAGSKHFEEAMRLGAEWRAEENRKSVEALDADS